MEAYMDKTELSAQFHSDGEDLCDAYGGWCQERIHVSVFTAESENLCLANEEDAFGVWTQC